jgi:hypothetical protein
MRALPLHRVAVRATGPQVPPRLGSGVRVELDERKAFPGLCSFYEIDHESRKVYILALGVKERERLLVGGEEVKL